MTISEGSMRRIIVIAIIAGMVYAGCGFFTYPRDGIYVLPQGFKGGVIILFEQENGELPHVEDGLFVYRIPSSGILRVSMKGYTGVVNKKFFFDDGKVRHPIDTLRITGDTAPSGQPQNRYGNISEADVERGVFVMNVGGLGSFRSPKGVISYTSFIVGTPKDSEDIYRELEDRLDKIQNEFTQRK